MGPHLKQSQFLFAMYLGQPEAVPGIYSSASGQDSQVWPWLVCISRLAMASFGYAVKLGYIFVRGTVMYF